jgi:hypothetical protein
VDPTVDFDWSGTSPDPSISQTDFSAVWSGQVEAQFSETYTFYTTTDDGVRLWVNNQLLIDKWILQPPTEWSGTIPLTAGHRYNIEMPYFQGGGGSAAHLSWASPSTPKQIIPQSQLFPTNVVPSVFITNPRNGASFFAPASFKVQALAYEMAGPIASVQFLAGNTLLGVANSQPFSVNVNNLSGGTYTLSAIATDTGGASATNSISITVQAPLKMSATLSGNSIVISWPDTGTNYTLQMNSSLTTSGGWSTAPVTPVKANGQVTATVSPTGIQQFYRLSQ